MKTKTKILAIIATLVLLFMADESAFAEKSGKPGKKFPGTCAAPMINVPQKDCTVSSYDEEEPYKTDVAPYIENSLAEIDFVGNKILVDKGIASNWSKLANAIASCPEVSSGTYPIKVYDHFCCRLQYGTSKLSLHASGKAVDINIDKNPWVGGHKCKPEECDIPPCVLKAMKDNDFSWGGSWNKPCDGQHIEWTGGSSNISEADTNVCANDGAATLNAGTTVGSKKTDIPLVQNEIQLIVSKPSPKITIPGLNFTDIKVHEENGGQFLYIPFLGEYIAAIYKYGVAIASIFAVVMIINAGFGWAISGGEPEKINHAKTRIGQAMMGLFLAVASYTILYIVNPDLVKFKSLRVQFTQPKTLQGVMGINDATFIPDVPTPSDPGSIFCGPSKTAGDTIDKDSKKISQDTLKGDNPSIPYYERITMYKRAGKYLKPDLIVVHATGGTGFLAGFVRPNEEGKINGGPGVHYVIDRNGDIAQVTLEKNIAWSVKSGSDGGTDAAKRSISYEIVNLNAVCSGKRYQSGEKYRYSGDGSELAYNNKKFFHPRCLAIKPMSPEKSTDKCACSIDPIASKTKGFVSIGAPMGTCWEIFPEEQLKKVAWLTAQIAKRYSIPIVRPVVTADKGCPNANWEHVCWNHGSGIVGHGDIQNQTHGDPGPAFNWKHFLELVNSYM